MLIELTIFHWNAIFAQKMADEFLVDVFRLRNVKHLLRSIQGIQIVISHLFQLEIKSVKCYPAGWKIENLVQVV